MQNNKKMFFMIKKNLWEVEFFLKFSPIFSEELNDDLVEADHMFALAIAYSEEDEDNLDRAVANRYSSLIPN